jgi:hypothetical protein
LSPLSVLRWCAIKTIGGDQDRRFVMALINQKHLEQQAFRLLDHVALIHNRDGRLRIDQSIYKDERFISSLLGFIDNPKNRLPRDDIGIRVRA